MLTQEDKCDLDPSHGLVSNAQPRRRETDCMPEENLPKGAPLQIPNLSAAYQYPSNNEGSSCRCSA